MKKLLFLLCCLCATTASAQLQKTITFPFSSGDTLHYTAVASVQMELQDSCYTTVRTQDFDIVMAKKNTCGGHLELRSRLLEVTSNLPDSAMRQINDALLLAKDFLNDLTLNVQIDPAGHIDTLLNYEEAMGRLLAIIPQEPDSLFDSEEEKQDTQAFMEQYLRKKFTPQHFVSEMTGQADLFRLNGLTVTDGESFSESVLLTKGLPANGTRHVAELPDGGFRVMESLDCDLAGLILQQAGKMKKKQRKAMEKQLRDGSLGPTSQGVSMQRTYTFAPDGRLLSLEENGATNTFGIRLTTRSAVRLQR